MCRALLYAGPPVLLDDLFYRAPNALVRQVWNPQQLEMLNLAGFGMVAWDPSSHAAARPFEYRSTALPMYDRNLEGLAAKVAASCTLAHVRGIPYRPDTNFGDGNLHPFQFPGAAWSMAHNGDLHRFSEMSHDLARHTDPHVFSQREGTTDSEAIYALVLSELAAEAEPSTPAALVRAIRRSLRVLGELRAAHGISTNSSVNLFFTNGRDLVALRHVFDFGRFPLEETGPASSFTQRYLSLWLTLGERFGRTEDGDWRMQGQADSVASVLIASEPLSRDTSGWVEVPEYGLVVAERTGSGFAVELLDV